MPTGTGLESVAEEPADTPKAWLRRTRGPPFAHFPHRLEYRVASIRTPRRTCPECRRRACHAAKRIGQFEHQRQMLVYRYFAFDEALMRISEHPGHRFQAIPDSVSEQAGHRFSGSRTPFSAGSRTLKA
jgi:hypothetical protein